VLSPVVEEDLDKLALFAETAGSGAALSKRRGEDLARARIAAAHNVQQRPLPPIDAGAQPASASHARGYTAVKSCHYFRCSQSFASVSTWVSKLAYRAAPYSASSN
jgi:hypothetical protein